MFAYKLDIRDRLKEAADKWIAEHGHVTPENLAEFRRAMKTVRDQR